MELKMNFIDLISRPKGTTLSENQRELDFKQEQELEVLDLHEHNVIEE